MGQFNYARSKWSENEFNQLLSAIAQASEPDIDTGWIAAVTTVAIAKKVLPRYVLAYESADPSGSGFQGLLPTSVTKDSVTLTPTLAYVRVIIDL